MATRQEIKERAKQQLGKRIFGEAWLTALLVLVIMAAIIGIANIIPVLGSLAVLGPVTVGVMGLFIKQARGTKMEIVGMFDGFKNKLVDNFLLGILNEIFIALWSMLFVIPGIVKTYSYAMCYYIKNDNPEMEACDCITASRKMMKGHKMELFVLDLSFIGWYIVGALCFGIGTLWVAAYHMAARAQFYEALKNAPQVENA